MSLAACVAHLEKVESNTLRTQNAARVAADTRKDVALGHPVAVAFLPLEVDAAAAHRKDDVRHGRARQDAVGLGEEGGGGVSALGDAARGGAAASARRVEVFLCECLSVDLACAPRCVRSSSAYVDVVGGTCGAGVHVRRERPWGGGKGGAHMASQVASPSSASSSRSAACTTCTLTRACKWRRRAVRAGRGGVWCGAAGTGSSTGQANGGKLLSCFAVRMRSRPAIRSSHVRAGCCKFSVALRSAPRQCRTWGELAAPPCSAPCTSEQHECVHGVCRFTRSLRLRGCDAALAFRGADQRQRRRPRAPRTTHDAPSTAKLY